jgi:hypothetical protein
MRSFYYVDKSVTCNLSPKFYNTKFIIGFEMSDTQIYNRIKQLSDDLQFIILKYITIIFLRR